MLMAGVALAAWAVLEYRTVYEALSVQEARTAEMRKAGKRTAASVRSATHDADATAREFKVAQLALQRLALRWDELFNALESTRTQGVALLAIEPDSARGIVKLTAEARTPEDMLDYIERLQNVKGLAEVVLASHQVKPSDPLQPTRFVALASWVK